MVSAAQLQFLSTHRQSGCSTTSKPSATQTISYSRNGVCDAPSLPTSRMKVVAGRSPLRALLTTRPRRYSRILRNPRGASTPMSTSTPRRVSQPALLAATAILLCVAAFVIPGGLTPRRVKQQILAKRVAEHLDVLSPHDPNTVVGGPLPIDTIHRRGEFHRGIWVFALDSHLRLLLSWRAPTQRTCPMSWTTLGEHSIANESFEQTAARGLAEEASFVVRPRMYSVGQPFIYNYIYRKDTPDQRTDNQWTQAFVVLPRGDALDFRTLDDREAEQAEPGAENLRYQGMSLPQVVHHAVRKPKYFCNVVQVKWMLRIIPLVIRVIKAKDKRLFRGYLREEWASLVQSGSPVCCHASEHLKDVNEVNISMCGQPCKPHTVDASDADALET